ncbi:MAG: helix-turn-helix domain-containing protein [Dehalococcoidales bacterium]
MTKQGRPSVKVDCQEVARFKREGLSFRQIARLMGIAASTAHMLLKNVSLSRS